LEPTARQPGLKPLCFTPKTIISPQPHTARTVGERTPNGGFAAQGQSDLASSLMVPVARTGVLTIVFAIVTVAAPEEVAPTINLSNPPAAGATKPWSASTVVTTGPLDREKHPAMRMSHDHIATVLETSQLR
jgi:hypothetical protein